MRDDFRPIPNARPEAEKPGPGHSDIEAEPCRLELPDPGKPFVDQRTEILLAMLLWGEARGEGMLGMRAVAQVVANRVRLGGWFGIGWKGVMLKPAQFSCFGAKDPNATAMMRPLDHGEPETWQKCLWVAREAMSGKLPDLVDGATHYFAVSIEEPAWARQMDFVRQIGRHRFYRQK